MVYCSRRLFERSLACYIEASSLAEERIRPRCCAVTLALQAGRGLDALEQARGLEATGTHSPSTVELIELIRREKSSGTWTPTAKSQTLVASIRDRMPSLARRMCDMFWIPHE
jgi:hypothetical protein